MAVRLDIRDASKGFLEGMAKSLARTIDAGQTTNADGKNLRELLEEVMAAIPDAPLYSVGNRRGK